MRRILINEFMTLDGVMQGPGGPDEDRTGNFKYGGWIANYWDNKMEKELEGLMSRELEFLLGRKTYEIFAAHWPYVEDDPIAEKLNKAKKYVASTTLDSVDWQNSQLLKGDVVKELIKLKLQDGPDILVYGSGNLVQTLLKNNLVDEMQLFIFPMIMGKGKRLFKEGIIPSALKLVDQKVSATGAFIATYQPAGEINLGSVIEIKPSEAEIERRKKWEVEQ